MSQPTPVQHADLLFIRTARACEAHPNAKLEVRIARMDDVKQKGARERSRFYLFNPEYDRGEEYERRYAYCSVSSNEAILFTKKYLLTVV